MAEEEGVVKGGLLEVTCERVQALVCSEEEQDEKQGTNQGGEVMPSSREVLTCNPTSPEAKESDDSHNAVTEYVINVVNDLQAAKNTHVCQSEMPWVVQEDLSGGSCGIPVS